MVYHSDTCSPGEPLLGHTKGINDVAWMHADSAHAVLVSASDDNCIKVWDVNRVSAKVLL